MVTNYQDRSVFGAIADPTRRAILGVLSEGELGAGELAERFPISRPAVSRHVRILKKAGLVRARVDSQRRVYSLNPSALQEVDQWLAPYRLFWSSRMVDLKTYVESNNKKGEPDG